MMDSPLNDIKIGEVTSQWAKHIGIKTNYFTFVDSTNLQAKKNAFNEEELENDCLLYITESQTQGRGRFDRTWISPTEGASLMATWSFYVTETPSPHFTLKVGLALLNSLKSTWQFLPFYLKAPNDIYIQDKKLAGILVETVSQGFDQRLLVGVGLNVLSSPSSLQTATSLIKNMPKSTPLLGEDWIAFCDRFFFELTNLVPRAHEDLTTTETANLLSLLNLFPHKNENYKNLSDIIEKVLNQI